MAWLLLPFLVAETALLAWLDHRRFGTWLTPATLLGVPFTVNILLCVTVGPAVGFVSLHYGALLVLMAGLAVLWLGGVAVALAVGVPVRAAADVRAPFLDEATSERLALLVAWACIPFIALHLVRSAGSAGGVLGVGTDEFAELSGSGAAAHLMALGSALFVFLVGVADRHKKAVIATAAVLGVLILVRQVKYAVLLPLTAGLVYRVLSGRLRVTVKGVALFVVAVFGIFAASYLIGFWAIDPRRLVMWGTYQFVLRHFLFYAQAGVLTFGELMEQGYATVAGDPRVTFSPFYNLYAAVTGAQLVGAGDEYQAAVIVGSIQESNVTTMFGPLLIGLGPWGAAVYTFVLGLLAYCAFAVATLSRNAWAVALWAMVAAMLAFGWWCLWFELLAAIEIPAFCAMLALALWLARGAARAAREAVPA